MRRGNRQTQLCAPLSADWEGDNLNTAPRIDKISTLRDRLFFTNRAHHNSTFIFSNTYMIQNMCRTNSILPLFFLLIKCSLQTILSYLFTNSSEGKKNIQGSHTYLVSQLIRFELFKIFACWQQLLDCSGLTQLAGGFQDQCVALGVFGNFCLPFESSFRLQVSINHNKEESAPDDVISC